MMRRRAETTRATDPEARWAIEERETAAAYRRQPDSEAEASFDPSVWEAPRRPSRRRSRR